MTERFRQLRKEYLRETLSEKTLAKSPFTQFDNWFNEAVAAELLHPNAMTLATTTPDGTPDARIVLLKEVKNEEFYFFTNYLSSKGRQLASNNAAVLLFFWVELERQVRIKGFVSKADEASSDNYFQTRPRGAQLAAVASPQSEVIESREWLEEKQKKLELDFATGTIARPPYWGGYVFKPHEFEFWQGRENRLHDRLRYRKNEAKEWSISRLAP